MPRNVNINFSPLTKGTKVLVDRWSTTVTITWIDDAGAPQSDTRAITFPDDLALMSNAWLKRALHSLIIDALRVRLGIDEDTA